MDPIRRNPVQGKALSRLCLRVTQILHVAMYATVASVLCGAWTPCLLMANPTGESVVAGQGTFDRNGSTLTVTQGSDRMIVNWQGFSINPWETTRFIQPGVNSAALNRVTGGDPSSIMGALQANGNIFLINPNGIVVGAGARIDVGGFLASTLDIADEQFMAGGQMNFLGNSAASVKNFGVINASNGDVILIGQEVENHGEINAPNGTAGLGAGNDIVLAPKGGEGVEGRLKVRVKESELGIRKGDKGVTNTGKINAATAELKAAGGNVYALAINNTGTVRANRLQNKGGRIFLSTDGGKIVSKGTLQAKGGRVVVNSASRNRARVAGSPGSRGTTEISGAINVSNTDAGQKGGTVHVLGDQVLLSSGARVDASGWAGGGEILVGGDYQGKNPDVLNAQKTFIDAGVELRADALISGDGGKIVIWADDLTYIGYSTLTARGGPAGGNGGFIETSGKQTLIFTPREVNVVARSGGYADGLILLDPNDIIVDVGGSDTPANDVDFSDAPFNVTYTPGSLMALSGSISLQASNNITINVGANLAFTQTSGEHIAFQAGNDIFVYADITTNGAALFLEAGSVHAPPGPPGTDTLHIGPGVTINTNGGDLHLSGAQFDIEASATMSAGEMYISNNVDGSTMTINAVPGNFPEASFSQFVASHLYVGKNFTAGDDSSLAGSQPINAGDLQIGNVSGMNANYGLITFQSYFNTIFLSGNATFGAPVEFTSLSAGVVTAIGPLTLTSNGTPITFNVPFELAAFGQSTINTNGGNVTFNQGVDSSFGDGTDSLTINAGGGNVAFNGGVGVTFSLDDLIIGSANNVTFGNLVRVNSFTQSSGTGTTHFSQDTDILTGDLVVNTNNILIGSLMDVAGDTQLVHSGSLTVQDLGDILTSNFLESGGATTLESGAFIDALGNLTMAGSSVTLNGNFLNALGSIDFIGPTTLQSGSALLFASDDINFHSNLSGPGGLVADAGDSIQMFGSPGTALGGVDLAATTVRIEQGIFASHLSVTHSGDLIIGGTSSITGTFEESGGGTTTFGVSGTTTFNVGSLNLPGTVNVVTPLVVIAGGGINIGSLNSSNGSGVTLKSAGAIAVSNSSGISSWALAGTQISIVAEGNLELASATADTLSLTAGGPITQTGAINVNFLTLVSGSTITLGHVDNKINFLGDVYRGGDLYIFEDPGMTIVGQINSGNINSNVTIASYGGDLTLAEGANIAVSGSGNRLTLATDGAIINNAGPNVFSLEGGAVFNLFAGDESRTFLNGLITDFVVYGRTFPLDADQIPDGNGIFYATGVNNILDAFVDAAATQLNADQPEMDFPVDRGLDLLGDGLGNFGLYDSIVNRNEAIEFDGAGNITELTHPNLPPETREGLSPEVEKDLAAATGTGEPNPTGRTVAAPGQPGPGEAPGLLTRGDSVQIDPNAITPVAAPAETRNALTDAVEAEMDKALGLDGTGTAPFDQIVGGGETSVLDGTGAAPIPPGQVPPELNNALTDSIERQLTGPAGGR
ncbi:hypothetical protein DB346_18910 [Verrucomicrobia bacterium LW23]|nr:hypothetical protein DB346_18910 [Verrucomicrobia bacterium LW23]